MQQTLQKQAHKTRQKNAWKYILSAVIILIYILPIYVLVNMAFKHPTDLGSRLLPPTYFDISNFTSIIESGKLFRALGNTVLIAVGTVAIEVVFGCMAAYAFARNRSRFNSFMQSFCLGIMMIPPLSILVFAVGGCEKISPYVNKVENPSKGFPRGMIALAVMVVTCAILGTLAMSRRRKTRRSLCSCWCLNRAR